MIITSWQARKRKLLKNAISIVSFPLLLSIGGNHAYADSEIDIFSLPLETLLHLEVETASKTNDEIYRAPGVVSVITRADIERYGGNNLRDVVGRLPGVLLLSDGDIQADNLGVRGEPVNLNNHLLLLLDGRPFRSVPGASDALRRLLNTFPLDLVEQIEFVRGPGSVLYGSSAYTGVINVITIKPEKSAQRITAGIGSHATRFGALQGDFVDGGEPNFFTLHAKGWMDDGWSADFIDINGNPATPKIGEKYKSITALAEYEQFSLNFFTGSRDSDRFGQRQGFTSDGPLKDEHVYTNLGYSFQLTESWEGEVNLSWLRMDVDEGDFKDDERLLEVDLRGRISDALELSIGASTLNTDFRASNPLLDNYKTDTTQLYAQASYKINDETDLILGGQVNRTQKLDWELVPRLGIIHQFNEAYGTKLLFSEAYRNPNAVETKVNIPGIIVGDPMLDAETVSTVDWEIFYHSKNIYSSLALFWSKQKNLIGSGPSTTPGYALQQQNKNERRIVGGEWILNYKLSEALTLDSSVSYQQNEELNNGTTTKDASTLPHVLAKLGLSYTNKVISLGIWDNYVSDFKQNEAFQATKSFFNPEAGAYHYVTAQITWKPSESFGLKPLKGLNIGLYIQNLLDETIRQNSLESATPLNTFPSDTDRSLYLSASLEF